jgi:hypothetical protein
MTFLPESRKCHRTKTRHALNTKNRKVISMCETLERKIVPHQLPYDLEEPDEKEITKGLMKLSQQALSKYVDNEPDIY